MSDKDVFIKICKENIFRSGIDDLLKWLQETDFFVAPASSKYHLSIRGGLCKHSINVYNTLIKIFNGLYGTITKDDKEKITIISLFHDLCKVNFYKMSTRKVKDEFGNWSDMDYYTIENKGPLSGHGVKSARIISKFINLTDDEFMAITYHMGFSSEEGRINPSVISDVFSKNDLAVLLNCADTLSTFIKESEDL